MSRRPFGTLDDGAAIEEVTLRAGAIEARVITWGAVLRDLAVHAGAVRNGAARSGAGAARHVVLGLDTIEDYVSHSRNFGAICGRVVNRLGGARITIEGRRFDLDRNFRGRHTLHGGTRGFSRRPWRIETLLPDAVTLSLLSPDGEGGFPGAVEARCTWRVEPPATLRVTLTATADAPTVLNLAPHPYFTLDDAPTIDRHRLSVAADFYTPTDDDGIPTGEIRSVEATPYDFRAGRELRAPDAPVAGYDVNLVLRRAGLPPGLPHVATLEGGGRDLALRIFTTEPGLQVFDGSTLALRVPGLGGRRYGARAGVAIEPQGFPDAPNRSHFPSIILRPGVTSRQESVFTFGPPQIEMVRPPSTVTTEPVT